MSLVSRLLFALSPLLLAAVSPAHARQDSPPRSPAEAAILKAVQSDELAWFAPDHKPVVDAAFLKKLCSGGFPEAPAPASVRIANVTVAGDWDLSHQEIKPYLSLKRCDFQGNVLFDFCRFKSGLNLSWSDFRAGASFQAMEVSGPFRCIGSHFHGVEKGTRDRFVDMSDLRVAGMLRLERSIFEEGLSLSLARIDGAVNCNGSRFDKWARFVKASVGGSLDLGEAHFRRGLRLDGSKIDGSVYAGGLQMENGLECDDVRVGGSLSLQESTFSDSGESEFLRTNTFRSAVVGGSLDLEGVKFGSESKLDFRGLKIGGSFVISGTRWPTAANSISMRGISFQDVYPSRLESFRGILQRSDFDADSYHSVERFLRSTGHSSDANAIGMEQARRQREKLALLPWLWSTFLDVLVGNGYSPGRALFWSLGVVVVGAYVFRKERMVGPHGGSPDGEAAQAAMPYSSLLYSFDLFVPAIALGVTDQWKPAPRWVGVFYWMCVQKALGWVLVPVGLLAFSGFIKA